MTHREFEHADLHAQRVETGAPYLEFLRNESFELGLYELAAGSIDGQRPHDEDEVYVVLAGRARFSVDGDDVAVGPGSILFVAKHAVHRFHSIEQDLSIFVAFTPPRRRDRA
ncbi:MAG: cupin domain-containing protein [Gaiellales bacterium]